MSQPVIADNDLFFDSIYKDVWKGIIPEGLSEVEAGMIMDLAQLKKGDQLLDLMCGYGRHALLLGAEGINVTAVDNLKEYIEEIGEKATGAGLPVTAILSGALELKLERVYDAAICMGNSFAFFNREEATGLLKKVSQSLKPGGTILINTWMIAEIAIRHFREKEWYYVGDFKYLLDYRFRFSPNRIESEQTIISTDGEVSTLHGVDYIFSLDEMDAMFAEAGLVTEALYGTPRKRPFAMGDNRIYILARKKS